MTLNTNGTTKRTKQIADTMNSDDIFTKGIMFKKVASDRPKEEKVKTKAKKKAYITGQHHSASAKMKAEIRRKRANRHK